MIEIPACQPASCQQVARIKLNVRPHDRAVVVGHLSANRLAKAQFASLKRKIADGLSMIGDDSDFYIGPNRRDGLRKCWMEVRTLVNARARLELLPQRPIVVREIGYPLQCNGCHGETGLGLA